MIRSTFIAACAIVLLIGATPAARAVAVNGNARNVPYVIGYHPLHSSQQPFLGQLHLNFNNGIISGTYTDISVRPGGPLANAHNVAVSGGLSGSQITLHIRQVTFRGTFSAAKMSGSSTINGSIYTWEAQQGSPGSGR